jgi:hypothetical protein
MRVMITPQNVETDEFGEVIAVESEDYSTGRDQAIAQVSDGYRTAIIRVDRD